MHGESKKPMPKLAVSMGPGILAKQWKKKWELQFAFRIKQRTWKHLIASCLTFISAELSVMYLEISGTTSSTLGSTLRWNLCLTCCQLSRYDFEGLTQLFHWIRICFPNLFYERGSEPEEGYRFCVWDILNHSSCLWSFLQSFIWKCLITAQTVNQMFQASCPRSWELKEIGHQGRA